MAIKVSRQEKIKIRKDWADALANCMLDAEYGELEGKEYLQWTTKDPIFLEKFRKDVKDFLETIVDYRLEQARLLIEEDQEYFGYIKDDFVNFACYGGTECRLIYRVFFALKGYDSFSYWLDIDGLDKPAVDFIRGIYATVFPMEMEIVK